jgi:3-phenylpropionate/trans-cinnamate dioxygenase ferredoxin subunit
MTMSEFIKLVATSDVPVGSMKEVESEGHPLMVANVGGTFLVADARCPHLGGHLAEGQLVGAVVTCPRHHSQFDLTDGHVVRWTDFGGAVLTIAELARHPRPLRVYEAAIENGFVMVGHQKNPVATP